MRLYTLALRFAFLASLVLFAAFCAGWKWGAL